MHLYSLLTFCKKNIKLRYLFCQKLFALFLFCLVTTLLFGNRPIQTATSTCACDPIVDSLAMVDLYNATNGPSWEGIQWDLTNPFQTWAGLTFNPSGCVTNIILSGRNLEGTLPASLGNVEALDTLVLTHNPLTGNIPTELGLLPNIRYIRLSDNQLTGSIPSGFGNMSQLGTLILSNNALTGTIPEITAMPNNLELFWLFNNQLEGSIPNSIGNLNNLTNFNAFNNNLSGNIPSTIGNLVNLEALTLGQNQLNGSIPAELGGLITLTHLRLGFNQLTGIIPADLGNLSALIRLDLDNNELEGAIPSTLGNLSNLTQLYLNNNMLSGTLPNQLFNLTNLTAFNLSNNQLSGEIPNRLSRLSQLSRIDLHDNQFDGVIPNIGNMPNVDQIYLQNNNLSGSLSSNLFNLTDLTAFNLSNNQLSGNIPNELGNLTKLHRIDLYDNQFDGAIPATISNLTNVAQIYLYNNNLSGPIPASMGSMTALTNLSLRKNQLSGPIPNELGALINLTQLRLDSNQLSGTIPIALSNLTELTNLILSNNQLTGEIPSSLGGLTKLFQLFLDHNQLTGAIPTELSNISTLFGLGLHNNQLSGNIPPALGNLSSLNSANLSDNQLEGTIPTSFDGLTNLEELYLFRNKLTGNIPTALGELENLRDLNLSYNQLTGTIPTELATLNKLVRLELYVNHLEGVIPDFSSLSFVEVIDLCCQKIGLSGEIPLSLTTLDSLKELRLHLNQLAGTIPDSLGNARGKKYLTHLNLSNNQLTGCIPITFFGLCNKEIQLNNNPLLLAGDDFATFCMTGEGACLANYECVDAVSLPMNESPCGRSYIAVKLNEASTSNSGPELSCNTTFVGNDLWFKVTVPSTGNFLIKNDSLSNIATSVEAYEGNCGSLTAIACAELDSLPFVLSIENRSEGETIYFRVWDQNNSIVNTNPNAVVALSAHQLAADKNEWELCDFPINLLDDVRAVGSGNRLANQFIIQFDSTATASDKEELANELISQNATLIYECPCQDQNQSLQLWGTENPIEMEERGMSSRRRAKVDTSNYNYLLEYKDIQLFAGTINLQDKSAVAIDDQGDFIMAWQDQGRDGEYLGVFAQRFQSDGTPLGADFQMNTTTYYNQRLPRLAIQPNGDFLGIWMSRISNDGVAGQRYKADGTKEGTEIRISDALIGQFPDIAMDATGNYVVVYDYLDDSGLGIYAQQFNQDGTPKANFFQVNTKLTNNEQQFPSVAMNSTGAFVVAWQSFDTLTSSFEVYATVYDANADTIKAEFSVNTEMNEDQRFPKVAMNDAGAFVITWQSFGQDGADNGVFAQKFDATGEKMGSETRINTVTAGSQSKPKITIYEDGAYFIVWEDFSANNSDIFGQLMSSDNQPIGVPIVINAITEGNQSNPDISMNSAGQMIISWESFNQNGSTQGIFGQRFNTTGTGIARVVTPLDNTTLTAGLGQIYPYATENYTPTNTTNKVRVAITDTGIADDHAAVMNALWLNPSDGQSCLAGDVGYDFINRDSEPNDVDGHGTSVNGMITNGFPNNIQLELINAKFYENSRGSVFDAICGIYYAVNQGAKIINLSWGFESEEYPKILYDALMYAAEKDVLIVASAGNTSKNNDVAKKYPANLDIPTMIVATAYQVDGDGNNPRLSSYASYGATSVDIAALGYAEVPDLMDDALKTAFGTSFAAPLVARTAAIIKGRFPFLSAADIKDCILSSVDITPSLNGLITTNGILNETAAETCAAGKAEIILDGACQNNFILDNNPVIDGDYHSETTIVSASLVNDSKEVTFQAEESITLSPGFHAMAGATFHALIDNCQNGLVSADTTVFDQAKLLKSIAPIAAATTLSIFPNPTTNYFTTRFFLTEPSSVQLQLFDINGALLKTINKQQLDKGWYEEGLEVSDFSDGVYIVQLRSNTATLTQKLVIQQP